MISGVSKEDVAQEKKKENLSADGNNNLLTITPLLYFCLYQHNLQTTKLLDIKKIIINTIGTVYKFTTTIYWSDFVLSFYCGNMTVIIVSVIVTFRSFLSDRD